jgi:hypothetical protein
LRRARSQAGACAGSARDLVRLDRQSFDRFVGAGSGMTNQLSVIPHLFVAAIARRARRRPFPLDPDDFQARPKGDP